MASKEIVIISISPERMVEGKPVRFLNKQVKISQTGDREYTFENDSQYAMMVPVTTETKEALEQIEQDFANGAESVTIN